jgi:hypothetical protein
VEVVGAAVVVGAEVGGAVTVVAGAADPAAPGSDPAPHAATPPSASTASPATSVRATRRRGRVGVPAPITVSVADVTPRQPPHRCPTAGPAAYRDGVETDTTPVTTLVGPNGTAPGMGFVQQQQKPVDDSSIGRGAGLPLAIGALILLVVFTFVLLKARRDRGSRRA